MGAAVAGQGLELDGQANARGAPNGG